MLVTAWRCRRFYTCPRNPARPWRQPLQTLAFLRQPHCRYFARSRVDARIGDFAQLGAHAGVRGIAINFEPFGTELAGQRHVKAAQITDETLHFAFGLRPAWLAQPRPKTIVMGKVEEGLIVAVPAGP